MYRKFAAIALIAGGLSLGSCSTLTPGTVSTITSAFIKQVDAVVATVCRAVPEVTAIVTLVNSGIGLSVGGVATAFCQAFQSAVQVTPTTTPTASRRFGRRFRAGGAYMCAGSICGWRL